MTRLAVARGTIACVGLFALGCETKPATVTGKVTYQARAATGGSVIIYCEDKRIEHGNIGTDGRYSIRNVPSGAAVVTVQSPARVPKGLQVQPRLPRTSGGPIAPMVEPTDTHRVIFPPRYAHPEESGLSLLVNGEQVTFDIDLKP